MLKYVSHQIIKRVTSLSPKLFIKETVIRSETIVLFKTVYVFFIDTKGYSEMHSSTVIVKQNWVKTYTEIGDANSLCFLRN